MSSRNTPVSRPRRRQRRRPRTLEFSRQCHLDHLSVHHDHTYAKNIPNLGDILDTIAYDDPLTDFFVDACDVTVSLSADNHCRDSCSCCADEHFLVLPGEVIQIHPDSYTDKLLLLSELKQNRALVQKTGFFTLSDDNFPLQFISLYQGDNPAIKCSVTIDDQYQAQVYVHRKQLLAGHTLWEKFTNRGCYSAKDIIRLLSDITNLNVCTGNPDEGFIEDFPCKSEVAYIDIHQYSDNDGISREKTVRVKTCELLTVNKRCIGCAKYRGSLRKRRSSLGSGDTNNNTGNNSGNNSKCHRYMSSVELIHKVDALNVEKKNSLKKIIL